MTVDAIHAKSLLLTRKRTDGWFVARYHRIYLMPVLPYLSDDVASLAAMMEGAREVGVDFVLFGGLTLKPGRQLEHFLRVLEGYDAALVPGYRKLYGRAGRYGNPVGDGASLSVDPSAFRCPLAPSSDSASDPTQVIRAYPLGQRACRHNAGESGLSLPSRGASRALRQSRPHHRLARGADR